jgi:hypothetical protein
MSMGLYNWKTGCFDRNEPSERYVNRPRRTNGQKSRHVKKWEDILDPNNHFLQVHNSFKKLKKALES